MTRLLVSVRDAGEAEMAAQAGVDLIDVKEPRRGSLGAADPEVLQAVLDQVAGRAPCSAACGECREQNDLLSDAGKVPSGLQYAKLGLAGCSNVPDWQALWQAWQLRLPPETAAVAVVYADWQAAHSPSAEAVLELAVQYRAGAVLIDTFHKDGRSLPDVWPLPQLQQFIERVQAEGLPLVLAGSLALENLAALLPLQPDYVAVRGAVCRPSREGSLDPDRLARLVDEVKCAGRSQVNPAPPD